MRRKQQPRKQQPQKRQQKKQQFAEKPLPRTIWKRIGDVSTAYGFIPSAGTAVMMGMLAFVTQQPPVWNALATLTAALVTVLIFRFASSKRVAYIILAVVSLVSIALYYNYYYSYKLMVEGVSVGLHPATLDRSLVAGVSVDMKFYNLNDFDVWVRTDRRRVIVDGMTQEEEGPPILSKILSSSLVGIRADPVVFRQNLPTRSLNGGSVDYDLCYGRTEDNLTKRISIQGRFDHRLDNSDNSMIVFTPIYIKEGSCD